MDRHSRIVKILTVLLPVLGMAMLFYVFTADWRQDEVITSQFDEEDTEFTSNQTEVLSPNFSTRNDQGDKIDFEASSVTKESETSNEVVAKDIDGALEVGGSSWEIQSEEGQADTQGEQATFRGRVMALIDGQYNLTSRELVADVVSRTFHSDFPIDVQSKRFDLSADRATMMGEAGTRVITLDGNVQGEIRLGHLEDEGAVTINDQVLDEDALNALQGETGEGENGDNE